MVSDMPAQGWSCATLVEGVKKAAALSGMTLRPEELAQARGFPVG